MSSSPSAAPAPWTSRERWALIAVVVVALVVRFACPGGHAYLDSANYTHTALDALDGGLASVFGFHQSNRLGMIVPPMLSVRLFGVSELSLLAYFGVLAVLDAIVVPWLLSRRLTARTTVLATGMYLLGPQAIRAATHNSADAAMATWAGMALLAIWATRRAPSTARLLTSGLLLGIAVLHKESALTLGPVGALAAWRAAGRESAVGTMARAKAVALFCVGVGLVLGAEAAAFTHWTGHPLFRYTQVAVTHAGTVDAVAEAAPIDRVLLYWPTNLFGSQQSLGVSLYLLLPVVLLTLGRRLGLGSATIAVWLWYPFLFTVFGTSSPSGWHPLLPYPRYLHHVILPMSIFVAMVVTAEHDVRWRRIAAVAAAGAGLVAASVSRAGGLESVAVGAAGLALTAPWLLRNRVPFGWALCCLLLPPLATLYEWHAGVGGSYMQAERRIVERLREAAPLTIVARRPYSRTLAFQLRVRQIDGIEVLPDAPSSGPWVAVVQEHRVERRLAASPELRRAETYRVPWRTPLVLLTREP